MRIGCFKILLIISTFCSFEPEKNYLVGLVFQVGIIIFYNQIPLNFLGKLSVLKYK